MDYKKTASEVLRLVGGEDNITHFEHCATRLRFSLADQNKADIENLKRVPGVMGVVVNAQCQVIIGNRVQEVYDEVLKMTNLARGASAGKKETSIQKKKMGAVLIDFMIGVFQPLIPAIAGGGLLKAMLSLFVMLGIMDPSGSVYVVFNNIGDAALYFLPLLVAVSAANKLKCNQMIALVAVGALILPKTTALLTVEGGTVLFGFTLQNIAYAYQIFPALLTVLWLAVVERFFKKISPGAIRVFFVPMMSLVVVVPSALLLLGPLGFNIGSLLTAVILTLHEKLGFVALAVLAMVLPFCIAVGMHKALVPYAISTYSTVGCEALYLPASLAHNIAESGACFGVFCRTKNKELRSTALSAGISALFGITEPALYGVTLQHKKALAGVVAGGGVAGLVIGLLSVKSYAIPSPGLASMAMFVDPTGAAPKNIIFAFVGFAVAFIASFVISFLLFKDDEKKENEKEKWQAGIEEIKDIMVGSPLAGTAIPLEQVKDPVFAGKVIGDGFAVVPSDGELVAPADGEVCMLADTGHAIGLRLINGVELLIHIGMDTVRLNGKYYDARVKAGDKVNKGQTLLKFDLGSMKAEGYDLTTPVIVSNGDRFDVRLAAEGLVRTGDDLFMTVMKE